MVAAVKGYRCIFVLPDKMSGEKIAPAQGLRRRGRHHADRRRRPTRRRATTASPTAWPARSPAPGGPTSSPTSPTPRSTTAPPARRSGSRPRARITAFVAGVGTGGTISGVGRYLKEQNPDVKIIGADPEGSVLSGGSPQPWKVEGIGEDFVPKTFNSQLVDDWVRVGDAESFPRRPGTGPPRGHPGRRLERHGRRRRPALRPPADAGRPGRRPRRRHRPQLPEQVLRRRLAGREQPAGGAGGAVDECLPTLWRRPGSGSSYMDMGSVRGGPRHHTPGCGRRNSMKPCTTFACGFSVSPRTSSWCGVTAFELDRGLETCLHLQHLAQKY